MFASQTKRKILLNILISMGKSNTHSKEYYILEKIKGYL